MSRTRTKPATTAAKTTAKNGKPEEVNIHQLLANMDRLLPKWKQYEEDRKAKVPREKRRGLKEHAEFEKCYSTLRKSGLKLADARKQVAAK